MNTPPPPGTPAGPSEPAGPWQPPGGQPAAPAGLPAYPRYGDGHTAPGGPAPGPYGTGPYGGGYGPPPGGPQPWGMAPPPPPPVKPYNGLAIAAFVTALLLVPAPVALVLGIVALVQLRTRDQQGKGLAVAGVAISGTVLTLLALGLAFGDDSDSGSDPKGSGSRGTDTDVFDLRVGDCFDTGNLDAYDEGVETTSVRVKPCDEPHEAEIIGSFDIEGYEDFPGADVLGEIAARDCGRYVQPYLLDTWKLGEEMALYFFHPEEVSWLIDDREVLCFVAPEDSSPVTGSLRGSEEDFEPAQWTLLSITAELDTLMMSEPFEDAELSDWHTWAGSMAAAGESQAAALRAAEWDDEEAAELAERLATAREETAPLWREAADAAGRTEFFQRYSDAYEASGYHEERQLRRHLDLAVGG